MNKIDRPQKVAAYEADYARWCAEQGALLREGRLSDLDRENLAEEIESLGKRDRREIESRMKVLLAHLLKWRFQPEKQSASWRSTLTEERYRIRRIIADSPSLKPYPAKAMAEEYSFAVREAELETGLPRSTFPDTCPFTIDDILDLEFYPKA